MLFKSKVMMHVVKTTIKVSENGNIEFGTIIHIPEKSISPEEHSMYCKHYGRKQYLGERMSYFGWKINDYNDTWIVTE